MIFSLDVRRARKGDCLLLHYGKKTDPGLIMIDGGPSSVYAPHLKPRIKEIRDARGLQDDEPLTVDLLMISHVDDDHIRGILDLTKEEIEALDDQEPLMLNVLDFWHNSFNEIIDHTPDELLATFTKQFGQAAVNGGGMSDQAMKAVEVESKEHPETVQSGLAVIASIAQGFRLRQDAKKLGYEPNAEFGGKLCGEGGRRPDRFWKWPDAYGHRAHETGSDQASRRSHSMARRPGSRRQISSGGTRCLR